MDREAHWIANDRRLREQTGSAHYVWRALLPCITGKIAIPDWCVDYLATPACNLFELAHGLDFCEHIVPRAGESDGDFGPRLAERHEHREISHQRTMELVPQALLLSGPGKSAFRDFESDASKMLDAMVANANLLRPSGSPTIPWRSSKEARHRKRRVKEGRKLSGMAKPRG